MYLRRCAASCLSFFSTVYPAFLCRAGRFDALGINDRIAWHRFAPGSLPGYFDQVPQYLLPQPTQTGTPVETVHSRIGWKIVRAGAATDTLFSQNTALRLLIPACSTYTFASRNRVVLSLPTVHLSGRSCTPAALYRFFSCVYFTACIACCEYGFLLIFRVSKSKENSHNTDQHSQQSNWQISNTSKYSAVQFIACTTE